MGKYDFDQEIDRCASGALKCDALQLLFGDANLTPLWVADTDFAVCPEISNALKQRVDHPIYGYASTPESYWQSIINWLKNRHQFDVAREELTFVPGVVRGIAYAINYFSQPYLGDHVRLSAMDATAKGLGLGEPTGVELPESIGHRANSANKKALHPEDPGWYQGDQILAAIGQSDNRFTPLQLCVYSTTLANQGIRYRATFLNRIVSSDYETLILESEPEVLSRLNISDEAYLSYKEGMRMVAHEQGGTAWTTFQNYDITICAKTGTAQTDRKGYSDNGAFICFAPYDKPQIAIAVYGEQAGHGSTLAVVAKSVLDAYFEVGEVGDVEVNENKLS